MNPRKAYPVDPGLIPVFDSGSASEPEIQALEEAGRLYPRAVRRLLTSTRDALPRGAPEGILAQPAYEWMLS